jgi:virginiamycin B lyase
VESALPEPVRDSLPGALWFTSGERVGRITATGGVSYYSKGISLTPLEIAAGPDGNVWFTEMDYEWGRDKIARITPAER